MMIYVSQNMCIYILYHFHYFYFCICRTALYICIYLISYESLFNFYLFSLTWFLNGTHSALVTARQLKLLYEFFIYNLPIMNYSLYNLYGV